MLQQEKLTIESRAIVRYIEQKYKGAGTELLPSDTKALGLAEQGAYLESSVFDPHASSFAAELVFKKSDFHSP